jgi:hypothetical protein
VTSQHVKNLEADRERRRQERERRDREAAGAGEQQVAVVETPQAAVPSPRPQPFTPDLIPEPQVVEVAGPLSPVERGDLEACERAFANADTGQWMRGKAAQVVRDGHLYREGGRTWPQYCEQVLGASESDVNRWIVEWPLSAAIWALWHGTRPVPASHVRALLPVAHAFGDEAAADGYVRLVEWAGSRGVRITAAKLDQLTAGGPPPLEEFQVRVEALERGETPDGEVDGEVVDGELVDDQDQVAGAEGGHPNLGDSEKAEENPQDSGTLALWQEAVGQLERVHSALAPAKVAGVRDDERGQVEALRARAEILATKIRNRARQR